MRVAVQKIKLVTILLIGCLILPATVFAAPQAGDIVFTVGRASYQYDGESISMSAAPVILNGRAYLPVRDVAQAMGFGVSWNPTSQTIAISPSTGETISGEVDLASGVPGDGDNLPVTVSIGSGAKLKGVLDTGATLSAFPDSYLRGLGYSPIATETNAPIALGTCQVFIYCIPYPLIWQNGSAISLGSGMVNVAGVVGGASTLIGCDILSQDSLNLNNGAWTLTVPNN